MLIICRCPKHNKNLVFWKNTATHALFKCPDCNYTGGDGVVHSDLPEKYNKLEAENTQLKKVILLAPGSDEKEFLKKYRKWWDTFYREIRSPGCNLKNIEQALLDK